MFVAAWIIGTSIMISNGLIEYIVPLGTEAPNSLTIYFGRVASKCLKIILRFFKRQEHLSEMIFAMALKQRNSNWCGNNETVKLTDVTITTTRNLQKSLVCSVSLRMS